MTLEEEYAILSYLPLSQRANIGTNISANIIANISARKKTETEEKDGKQRRSEYLLSTTVTTRCLLNPIDTLFTVANPGRERGRGGEMFGKIIIVLD